MDLESLKMKGKTTTEINEALSCQPLLLRFKKRAASKTNLTVEFQREARNPCGDWLGY